MKIKELKQRLNEAIFYTEDFDIAVQIGDNIVVGEELMLSFDLEAQQFVISSAGLDEEVANREELEYSKGYCKGLASRKTSRKESSS